MTFEEWYKETGSKKFGLIYKFELREIWDYITAVERERAARVVEPSGPRPCACERCDCGNRDDAESVARWDEAASNAAAIRTGR